MTFGSVLRESAQALRFNRQRSILTMLSLGWGVACFIILYSYGDGFHAALTHAFHSVGQDLILMHAGQTSSQAGGERAGRRVRLEIDDVAAIRENVSLVGAVSPEVLLDEVTVVRGARTQTLTTRGVAEVYGRIRNQSVVMGRWFTAEDQLEKRRVAVLGPKASEKLFGEIPPVDEEITLNGMRFTVIGLLRSKTQLANYSTPDNECVFIPYEASSLFTDPKYPRFLVWSPVSPVFRAEAVRQVRATLARQHNFAASDDRAIRFVIFSEYERLVDTMGTALRILLGFIGALTLAIGGVGLANIMFVSVTQRTREIGVLKSIGATRRAVMAQFLVEALTIVTAGGILGVLVGWAATSLLGTLPLLGPIFKDETGVGDIHLHISLFAVVTSTLMLEAIGLIAGLLPAIKASRLDPIEALRYE